MTTDSLVESKRQKVAADYQARGFDVFLEPDSEQFGLPPNLGLDLVAVRGDERVAIEVKTPPLSASSPTSSGEPRCSRNTLDGGTRSSW